MVVAGLIVLYTSLDFGNLRAVIRSAKWWVPPGLLLHINSASLMGRLQDFGGRGPNLYRVAREASG